jgi:hypothetical protein
MTSLIASLRRTAHIVLADLRLLISLYVARSMVRRAIAAERKTARKNFRDLRRLRELEIQ